MARIISSTVPSGFNSAPLDYIDTDTATAFADGVFCVITNGKLAVAGATTTPTHITQGVKKAGETKRMPCARVRGLKFTAKVNGAGALVRGDKVTLDAGAAGLTDTKTGGVAEIETAYTQKGVRMAVFTI